MNSVKPLPKVYRTAYFSALAMLFILGALPVFFLESKSIVLALNSSHKPWLDLVARIITQFGSLWFYILFLGILFFCGSTIKQVAGAGVSFFGTCILVEILKLIVFPGSPRPIDMIPVHELHVIDGFAYDHFSSFPSGHASTIFVAVVVLSFLFMGRTPFFHASILLFAILVAMSRVYLSMHFYHDVYVGAFIGTFCTLAIHYSFCVISLPYWMEWNFSCIVKKIFSYK